MSTLAPSNRNALESPYFPWDALHQRAGRELPRCRAISASDIPDPWRSLLVHDRDMTGTLERHHGSSIHLELLSSHEDPTGYWREVVLRLDGSNAPAEFGAILIHLEAFPPGTQRVIRAGVRPLGSLLNESGRRYLSRPTAYLEVHADDFLSSILRVRPGTHLYGRINQLSWEDGTSLARIVEILP